MKQHECSRSRDFMKKGCTNPNSVDTFQIDDYTQIDELKARKEQRLMEIKRDKEEQLKRKKVESMRKVIAEENYQAMLKVHSRSPQQDLKEKKANSPGKDDIWATIRLPEIVSGMEEKDFIKIRKDKQKEFKRQLDTEKKKNERLELFGGMTDNEDRKSVV